MGVFELNFRKKIGKVAMLTWNKKIHSFKNLKNLCVEIKNRSSSYILLYYFTQISDIQHERASGKSKENIENQR